MTYELQVYPPVGPDSWIRIEITEGMEYIASVSCVSKEVKQFVDRLTKLVANANTGADLHARTFNPAKAVGKYSLLKTSTRDPYLSLLIGGECFASLISPYFSHVEEQLKQLIADANEGAELRASMDSRRNWNGKCNACGAILTKDCIQVSQGHYADHRGCFCNHNCLAKWTDMYRGLPPVNSELLDFIATYLEEPKQPLMQTISMGVLPGQRYDVVVASGQGNSSSTFNPAKAVGYVPGSDTSTHGDCSITLTPGELIDQQKEENNNPETWRDRPSLI
jgi:hypothetical protein